MADEGVRRLIDFSDLPPELADKKQRMERLKELGRTVAKSRSDWTGIDPQEFWRLFGGSPHYDVNEKEKGIRELVALTEMQLRELYELLVEDEKRLISGYGDQATKLYETLARGEMADAFEWESAAAIGGSELAYVAIASRINQAFGRVSIGDASRAEMAFQSLAMETDLAPRAWNGLGNLLTDHLGRHQEAEQAYRRAIELDPQDARPRRNLGVLLDYYLQRYEEAERAYRASIALDPENAVVWNNLGRLLTRRFGRVKEAEKAYRAAIELNPKYAAPWINLGHLLAISWKRNKEAEQTFRYAIQLEPKLALGWSNLGGLLLRLEQRLPEAGNALIRAAQLDPTRIEVLEAVLGISQKLSSSTTDWGEAVSLARQTLEIFPNDLRAMIVLAEVLTRGGRWTEARELAQRVLRDTTADPNAYTTAFCAAAVKMNLLDELISLFRETGADERWRPVFEAFRAAETGSSRYLNRVAPEVRVLARKLLREIAPDLSDKPER